MIRKLLLCLFVIPAFMFAGCSNEGDDGPIGPQPTHDVSRTLFIYMAADNSLGETRSYDNDNLEQIKSAAIASNLNGGKVVVFHDPVSGNSRLIQYAAGSNGYAVETILKDYGENLDASDPKVLTQAINDTKELARADSYGLILWSHGTGWIPFEEGKPYRVFKSSTASFGQDGSSWMELDQLAAAIPNDTFDFIIFDACLMGQVEVAYALRNRADYLIASPAEVLAAGFPYQNILNPIFAETPKLGKDGVAGAFADYYSSRSFGSIALYNLSEMTNLATVMKKVINANIKEIPDLSINGLQVYDRYTLPTSFDLTDFVKALPNVSNELMAEYNTAIGKVVEYKSTSGKLSLPSLEIDQEHFSGISTFIPIEAYDDLWESYIATAWGKYLYPSKIVVDEVSRTFFIYMAADNSLTGNDESNLEALVFGATYENINTGKVIVFHDRMNGTSRLLEVSANEDRKGELKVLKDYGSNLNSGNPEVLAMAIEDMLEYAPADSYGLDLWSHGTGWMPLAMHKKYTKKSTISASEGMRFHSASRAFGEDGSSWLELKDLVDAIPENVFDFMLFDACYMGQIEVAYALKDKVKSIIASPAEVVATGMPYDKLIPYIFLKEPVLGADGVAQAFYEYYAAQAGSLRSGTIAVYETAYIEPLADVMKKIIDQERSKIYGLSTAYFQVYDLHDIVTMFDITSFVTALIGTSGDLYEEYTAALNNFVSYKETTGRVFNLTIDKNRYNGLGVYIPRNGTTDLNDYYYQTDWYKRVY